MGHVTNRNDSALSSSVILFFSSMSAPCKADIATAHTLVCTRLSTVSCSEISLWHLGAAQRSEAIDHWLH